MKIVKHRVATLTKSISVAEDLHVANRYYLIDDDTGKPINANAYPNIDTAINELTWIFGGSPNFKLAVSTKKYKEAW